MSCLSEHCIIGIKGNPALNRNIDCDVIVSEVRETSRKPDEIYNLIERLSPNTRKLGKLTWQLMCIVCANFMWLLFGNSEIFGRQHNTRGIYSLSLLLSIYSWVSTMYFRMWYFNVTFALNAYSRMVHTWKPGVGGLKLFDIYLFLLVHVTDAWLYNIIRSMLQLDGQRIIDPEIASRYRVEYPSNEFKTE